MVIVNLTRTQPVVCIEEGKWVHVYVKHGSGGRVGRLSKAETCWHFGSKNTSQSQ